MTVRLMLTCLCDTFYGEVGIATVRVLEHAGCKVLFESDQTCCGQPPYNAGDWNAARSIASKAIEVLHFNADVPVVTPSSSCAAMIREGYERIFGGNRRHMAFELTEFLHSQLGIAHWPLAQNRPVNRKIAYHRACHGRALHLGDTAERLLSTIPGLEVLPISEGEQCCGFGGAFSISHGFISAHIGQEKLSHVLETGADTLVSGDMGCLMHLSGLIAREKLPVKVMHVAEVLAEALPESVPA